MSGMTEAADAVGEYVYLGPIGTFKALR